MLLKQFTPAGKEEPSPKAEHLNLQFSFPDRQDPSHKGCVLTLLMLVFVY